MIFHVFFLIFFIFSTAVYIVQVGEIIKKLNDNGYETKKECLMDFIPFYSFFFKPFLKLK